MDYLVPIVAPSVTALVKAPSVAAIALANTVDLSIAGSNAVDIGAGTGPLNAFGTVEAGTEFSIRATVAFTLTHHATSMICPTGASIVVAIGDSFRALSLGGGNWHIRGFQRADGTALACGAAAASPNTFALLKTIIG